jgi:hypothetical protein
MAFQVGLLLALGQDPSVAFQVDLLLALDQDPSMAFQVDRLLALDQDPSVGLEEVKTRRLVEPILALVGLLEPVQAQALASVEQSV